MLDMDSAEDLLFEEEGSKPSILFVDDEASVLKALQRFSRARRWDADVAQSGKEGLEKVGLKKYDVIVSDMRMPEMNGTEFLRIIKRRSPSSARILLTGFADLDALESVINEIGVCNYVNKPWNDLALQEMIESSFRLVKSERERIRLEELTKRQNKKLSKLALVLDKRLKESNIETQQALALLAGQEDRVRKSALDSISIVTQILDWKEGRDRGHTRFVEEYGTRLAENIGLDEVNIDQFRIAAKLHQIGMLCLPDEIRDKPYFSLTKDERLLHQRYPIWGEMALSSSASLANTGIIIRHHQEYVNGNGFPDRLSMNQIPIESQIICLLGDFYDVFNGQKVKEVSGLESAIAFINEWKGKHYDVALANEFLNILGDFDWSVESGKTILLEHLKVGDTLARDIVVNGYVTLLKKKTCITKSHIEKLKQYQEKFSESIEVTIEDSKK